MILMLLAAGSSKTGKDFLSIISKKDLFIDLSKLKDNEEIISQLSNDLRSAISMAIKRGKWDDVEVMSGLKIPDIRKWLYFYAIHREDRIYSEPNIYKIFDLARQGIKVVTSDASFSQELHNAMLGRYIYEDKKISRSLLMDRELKSVQELEIKRYKSNIKDDTAEIYRMWEGNYFYKSFWDQMEPDLQKYVNRTRRKKGNIGLITYQEKEYYIRNVDDRAHFGNLRGINTFENKEAVFVIGSFLTPDEPILEDYNNLFLTDFTLNYDVWRPRYKNVDKNDPIQPGGNYVQFGFIGGIKTTIGYSGGLEEKKPEPIQEVPFKEYVSLKTDEIQFESELKKHNKYIVNNELLSRLKKEEQEKIGEVDLELLYPVQQFDKEIIESEIYQAIHRARPLINQSITLYIFGYVPEDIKTEFNVVTMEKKETHDYYFIEFRNVSPSVLASSITRFCYTNPKATSLEVAKTFNLLKRDKKNLNTHFVTLIKKSKVTIEDVNKIDEAIRSGKLTINDLGKKHSDYAPEDEFVDYCIIYANKKLGEYIRLK